MAEPRPRTTLETDEKDLLARAQQAAKNADPKWSGFSVGAAVLSAKGAIYTGANFENDSYSMTICAERAAIACGIAEEGRSFAAAKVAVYAAKDGNVAKTPSPCGACRQVMFQYGPGKTTDGEETPVDTDVIFSVDGTPSVFKLAALLPVAFRLE